MNIKEKIKGFERELAIVPLLLTVFTAAYFGGFQNASTTFETAYNNPWGGDEITLSLEAFDSDCLNEVYEEDINWHVEKETDHFIEVSYRSVDPRKQTGVEGIEHCYTGHHEMTWEEFKTLETQIAWEK